jgi:hypothetical protein
MDIKTQFDIFTLAEQTARATLAIDNDLDLRKAEVAAADAAGLDKRDYTLFAQWTQDRRNQYQQMSKMPAPSVALAKAPAGVTVQPYSG